MPRFLSESGGESGADGQFLVPVSPLGIDVLFACSAGRNNK